MLWDNEAVAGFEYRADELVADGVAVADIAAVVGTPVYVYSAAAIRARIEAFTAAFRGCRHTVHYALKANSTLAIARLFAEAGCGADANSGGELGLALRAGFEPRRIVFTGVGKTREELDEALRVGVKAINVESAGELERLETAARRRGARAPVAIRVNPDIDPRSHPYITTGLRSSKFGVPLAEVLPLARRARESANLELVGLHVHIGSQITALDPLREAAAALVRLAERLAREGIRLAHLDVGGGLAISYDGAPVPTAADYAAALVPLVRPLEVELLLEPGRALVGPAGVLLTRVVDVKAGADGRLLVVLDSGMTELLRPALYGAFHRVDFVRRPERPTCLCDLVGPLCESSDVVGLGRLLPSPRVDDLLAIFDVGAYGSAMASTYNRRALPPEVLIEAGTWRLIRRRQTLDDQLACEL